MQHRDLVHVEPVWRERANFIIAAKLEQPDQRFEFEQLWARKVAPDEFELCCIPFFIYGCALGDIVKTTTQEGNEFVVTSVVKPSGHSTYRVWFGGKKTEQERVIAELAKAGALIERSSQDLVAIDAPTPDVAKQIAAYLVRWEREGLVQYEEGYVATR